ncbi:hypothetical protein FRACYDRAFT_247396 [Fragilariopsis cylindrus CCMP1102]|uniref:Uncharacterized protein n=1 Tax=Fragilariopsis cylindrus CCMP1102 TaxID=635003 RepID=A0A1E7EXU2_9STRA|nr:hypothetical protein FRACYDRAFT_247396 [Fragilariopsis cylindrus CCMP1102]|eukprot:OEU10363.1 hypothetical protein FRACYDRAFT_247396 [Fragilariopsis cylindrus CCMP1102]
MNDNKNNLPQTVISAMKNGRRQFRKDVTKLCALLKDAKTVAMKRHYHGQVTNDINRSKEGKLTNDCRHTYYLWDDKGYGKTKNWEAFLSGTEELKIYLEFKAEMALADNTNINLSNISNQGTENLSLLSNTMGSFKMLAERSDKAAKGDVSDREDTESNEYNNGDNDNDNDLEDDGNGNDGPISSGRSDFSFNNDHARVNVINRGVTQASIMHCLKHGIDYGQDDTNKYPDSTRISDGRICLCVTNRSWYNSSNGSTPVVILSGWKSDSTPLSYLPESFSTGDLPSPQDDKGRNFLVLGARTTVRYLKGLEGQLRWWKTACATKERELDTLRTTLFNINNNRNNERNGRHNYDGLNCTDERSLSPLFGSSSSYTNGRNGGYNTNGRNGGYNRDGHNGNSDRKRYREESSTSTPNPRSEKRTKHQFNSPHRRT